MFLWTAIRSLMVAGMRALRLLGEGRSFYHVVSRVVDRRKVFESRDKEVFRRIMRKLEAFMGVRVVTYCFMSNHFHLLIEVPDREELPALSEDELLGVLPKLHDAVTVAGGEAGTRAGAVGR